MTVRPALVRGLEGRHAMKAAARTHIRLRGPAKQSPPTPRFSADLRDPPFWQAGLPFGDKIQRLCALSPEKAHAIHVLVDLALREVWWQTARTSEGLAQLLTLTRDGDERSG